MRYWKGWLLIFAIVVIPWSLIIAAVLLIFKL
jgi:hypothetical protein